MLDLGSFANVQDCLWAAVAHGSCPTPVVMWSGYSTVPDSGWGCRCCADDAGDGSTNENWDIYCLHFPPPPAPPSAPPPPPPPAAPYNEVALALADMELLEGCSAADIASGCGKRI